MFRNEVTRLDAITAILCIEASMTTSAIVDSVGNALHSNFAENPDQECILSRYLFLSNTKTCIQQFLTFGRLTSESSLVVSGLWPINNYAIALKFNLGRKLFRM